MSRSQDLILLTFITDSASAESVSFWLHDTLGLEPIEHARPGDSRVRIECYLETEIQAEVVVRAVENQFRDCPLSVDIRPGPIHDWTEYWKRHFQAQEIGSRLWLAPPWSESPPPKNRTAILINPGMGFGTGNHFTTRFCLEALEIALQQSPVSVPSVLDAGTGSGVLSIAAAKLGAAPVQACDIDEQALQAASNNVSLNQLNEADVALVHSDLLESGISGSYDIVLANLYGLVLIELAEALIQACTWRLILSGIRVQEADSVASTFQNLEARQIGMDADHEWCGLIFDTESIVE